MLQQVHKDFAPNFCIQQWKRCKIIFSPPNQSFLVGLDDALTKKDEIEMVQCSFCLRF